MKETYVIYVSGDCNCDCAYCYLKNHDDTGEYTWPKAKEYIDTITSYNNDFNIEFLGGEPMLNSRLIQQVVDYLEAMPYTNVGSYTITNNGTIIDDTLIQLMRKNKKVKWMASMDGTKWANQLRYTKERVNTHDMVIDNFKKLLNTDNIELSQLGIHMVTHPYNIYLLADSIQHVYNLGFRHIGIGTVESTIEIGKEYCDLYISELDKVSQSIITGNYPGIYIDVLNGLKPRSDIRHYIKDKDGTIIGETYGRQKGDITDHNHYHVDEVHSDIGSLIEDIREIVYNTHQKRLRR